MNFWAKEHCDAETTLFLLHKTGAESKNIAYDETLVILNTVKSTSSRASAIGRGCPLPTMTCTFVHIASTTAACAI